jgi:hypothetical protein
VLNIDLCLAGLILMFQGGQTVCGVYVTDYNRKRIVAIMIVLGVLLRWWGDMWRTAAEKRRLA